MARRWPRGAATAVFVAGIVLLARPPASTAAGEEPAQAPPDWHLFFGADATSRSFFAHQGFVWAPFGHLHEAGFRLRGMTSAGAYLYRTHGFDILGQAMSAELLPGFQWMRGSYGASIYGGLAVEDHRTRPYDPGKDGQGMRFGGKALVEGWARIGERLTVDASAEYASASRSYALRLAARMRLSGPLVLEPEVAAFGEPGYHAVRFGLFAELYRSASMRVLAGGGWSVDEDGDGPYGSLRIKRWR